MIIDGGVSLSKELIVAARNGSDVAFSELTEKYRPLIETMTEKYSRSIEGFEADRDDLRQESSVVFYKAVMTYDLDQSAVSFGLYAKICIRNRLISLLRSSKSKRKIIRGDAEEKIGKAREVFFDREELEQLTRDVLSRKEREIFLMYADGKSYAEISSTLGIVEKSVDNALFRAKKKLRIHYSEH